MEMKQIKLDALMQSQILWDSVSGLGDSVSLYSVLTGLQRPQDLINAQTLFSRLEKRYDNLFIFCFITGTTFNV